MQKRPRLYHRPGGLSNLWALGVDDMFRGVVHPSLPCTGTGLGPGYPGAGRPAQPVSAGLQPGAMVLWQVGGRLTQQECTAVTLASHGLFDEPTGYEIGIGPAEGL
jgi:hypothetical protein